MEDDSSSKLPVVKLVGLETPLLRLRSLSKLLGFDGIPVYLKYEGVNPTGTHKDRAARAHVARAVELGMDTITVGTCGNYGVAISYFARQAGLRSVIFVPKSYENSRVEEMKKYGARVVFIDGSYEEAVELSSRAARANGWYDANPGTPSDEVSFEAYSAIASEIVGVLGDAPYAVAVPVGNGTTLAGIYFGFLRAYREGETTRIPRLIAGTTALGNQVAASWRRGSSEPVAMSRSEVKETPVNEPLVAYKSLSASQALEALVTTKGRVYEFSDEELVEMAMLLRVFERVSSLPASASSVLALKSFLSEEEEVEGPLVAVITGRWRRTKH